MATTLGSFLTGVTLFAYGLHLSYVNIAPQQARGDCCFVQVKLDERSEESTMAFVVSENCYP
ncbi:hypothetical protein PanWU01x14_275080 [Parasponia andersonii]|uniref:Uncharacterized protein n=1 Tax=Parasponia andersonii TaxID=3476 RepID=A0A2P5B3D6_PARAD|nr:hypothetical protein PanWU01x14_275080 [Parasponia andersonii]